MRVHVRVVHCVLRDRSRAALGPRCAMRCRRSTHAAERAVPRQFGTSVTPARSKAGSTTRTAATCSSSAISIATPSRRWTCRSARTTASSRAVPTWASRRTSCRAASTGMFIDQGAEGVHAAEQRLTWTIVANGQTMSIPLPAAIPTTSSARSSDIAVEQHAADAAASTRTAPSIQGPDRDRRRKAIALTTAPCATPLALDRLGDRRCEVFERHRMRRCAIRHRR